MVTRLPLDEVRRRAAAAATLEDLESLYRPTDTARMQAALRALDPSRIRMSGLRPYMLERSLDVRVALLENPRCSDAQVTELVQASLHHSHGPEQVKTWLRHLWDALPARRTLLARAFLATLGPDSVLPSSIQVDIQRALLELDGALDAEHLRHLATETQQEEHLALIARHPAADAAVWHALVGRLEHIDGNMLRWVQNGLLTARPLRDTRVRAYLVDNGDRDALSALARTATPHEAPRLLERIRSMGDEGEEASLLAALPAEAVTREVRAFALRSPHRSVRVLAIALETAPPPTTGRSRNA